LILNIKALRSFQTNVTKRSHPRGSESAAKLVVRTTNHKVDMFMSVQNTIDVYKSKAHKMYVRNAMPRALKLELIFIS